MSRSPEQSVLFSIVIPTFRRLDCVRNLLRDLYAQTDVDFEVIVVDDASPDNTVATIRDEFSQVIVLENEKNGGPCFSRNRGIRIAKGEWIVGLDSDVTIPDKALLAKLRQAILETTAASGFAFRVFASDGVDDDIPRWWHPRPPSAAGRTSFETDYFSGTAFAFRRDHLVLAGMFPEILYQYYEEVELAFRLLDLGGKIIYRPDLAVLHHPATYSRRSEIQDFYRPRNQVLLAMSCFPLGKRVQYLIPRISYRFLLAIRYGRLKQFMQAMKDAVAKSSTVLRTRQPLRPETLRYIESLRSQYNRHDS